MSLLQKPIVSTVDGVVDPVAPAASARPPTGLMPGGGLGEAAAGSPTPPTNDMLMSRKSSAAIYLLSSVFCLLCFTGCATEYIEIDRAAPPYFRASNFFVAPETTQVMPKRVLVLPCYGSVAVSTLGDLNQVLAQELAKVKLFEVIPPTRVKIANRRNDQEFNLQEASLWAREVGADGLLITHVTSCRPHRPLVLSVAMKLWNIPKETAVWSVDETLDSQLTPVANGARNYYLSELRVAYPTRRSDQILESPRMFFQYAFSALLSTLPHK